jgi:hypothetical protein
VDEKARQPRESNLYQKWRWILDCEFPSQIASNGRILHIFEPGNSSFFSNVEGRPGWKVVLQNEARSRREVVDTLDVFITTTVEASGLIAPKDVSTPPTIELSAKEHLLATANF